MLSKHLVLLKFTFFKVGWYCMIVVQGDKLTFSHSSDFVGGEREGGDGD